MVPLSEPIPQSHVPLQKITYEPMILNGKHQASNVLQEMGYSTIKTSTLVELAMYHHQKPSLPLKITLLKPSQISSEKLFQA